MKQVFTLCILFSILSLFSCVDTKKPKSINTKSSVDKRISHQLDPEQDSFSNKIVDPIAEDTILHKLAETIESSIPNEKQKASLKPLKVKRKYKAEITFDNPILNFGEINEGDIINHDFIFTNTGKADLMVSGADPSCGCTFPSIPFVAIKPGEQGKIGVQYNSVGKSGPQTATVTIKSNASLPSFDLLLEGTVIGDDKEEVLIDPREAVKRQKEIQDTSQFRRKH